ncbi:hypothetical protein A6A03_04530 [Chloroflexus islandicus]|uniref:DUF1156 domain-containing protein n=1 Tax=Chloroflexus islandicus TaxID=1707952 RepID=A0A178M0E4_9CHLR|nr:DUF1156 domain-containing protein [Chloroflexus islandicus]OAN40578.1 hypothetical protein A6A03_04530 [Chloroflexus islandicus]
MPTRKLIEVALPLDAINKEAAREKSIRHGHPSTLHLWWARRPLAACRAVLFASLIDDPSSHPDQFPTEEDQQRERERLFGIIERLVKWENAHNEEILREAHNEILKHTNGYPPPVYDPFAGGGSIPLEAQRLGLEAHASDLNPVAVLINKALIELPPKFANLPPVSSEHQTSLAESLSSLFSLPSYRGAAGLAADVRYYGKWMRDEAERRIGYLYPKVKLPKDYGGGEATVIAWLWARTVKCPNPACGAQMPLVRSFELSKKKGKEHWVEPVIEFVNTSGPAARAPEGEWSAGGSPAGDERSAGMGGPAARAPEGEWSAGGSPAGDEWSAGMGGPAARAPEGEWSAGGSPAGDEWSAGGSPAGDKWSAGMGGPAARAPEGEWSAGGSPAGDEWSAGGSPAGDKWSAGMGGPAARAPEGEWSAGGSPAGSTTRASVRVRFTVRSGSGKPPAGTVGRRGARCLCCDTAVPLEYIRAEGRAGRMGAQMMAIVAEGRGGRIYLPPVAEHEQAALRAHPAWAPETDLPEQALGFRVQNYGFTKHRDLFTPRQLVALTTFSDLIGEARVMVQRDAARAGFIPDPAAYADAVATYLAFSVSKAADLASSQCHWQPNPQHLKIAPTFARHALSMNWDYAEGNPFSDSSGNFWRQIELICEVLDELYMGPLGLVKQQDATQFEMVSTAKMVISTDPPYYDNVPYADLSDFFYVWLRHSLKDVYPELFGTLLAPKAEELVAEPFRHGGREAAQRFFEEGLRKVFDRIRSLHHPDYPLTVYYAFKQAEVETVGEGNGALADDDDEAPSASVIASTGWETMLQGLIQVGFTIVGTWPIRTERPGRLRETGSNALASSIVLVCRPRPAAARVATRREFLSALRAELPEALRRLQQGNIAPVDLAQAAIGPGMAVFSRYSKVIEADGSPMRVRTALQIINQELDAVLAAQEGEFDSATRWAIAWFEQYGLNEGPYGLAETLSKAKNTSVEGMGEAGIIVARSGKVRLLRRDELPADWESRRGQRMTIWEITQYLVYALEQRGENGAAALLAQLGGEGEIARDLAYRLYMTCERKGWAQEAQAYNSLVVAWPEIRRLAAGSMQNAMKL